ncbi:hypothetical protein [Ideonella sp. YS5]|uniref:hypothetical protein n=1 Tax=Ideonella sp. YS5 TaxID=3453714 RepID=UPI003EEF85AB
MATLPAQGLSEGDEGELAGVPYDEAPNRLGSGSGLMTQAAQASAPEAFVPGDIKTARLFGRHFAETLGRLSFSG